MSKYTVWATRTTTYKVKNLEATGEIEAYKKLDDWISDDFEGLEQFVEWSFEAQEESEDE